VSDEGVEPEKTGEYEDRHGRVASQRPGRNGFLLDEIRRYHEGATHHPESEPAQVLLKCSHDVVCVCIGLSNGLHVTC